MLAGATGCGERSVRVKQQCSKGGRWYRGNGGSGAGRGFGRRGLLSQAALHCTALHCTGLFSCQGRLKALPPLMWPDVLGILWNVQTST
jgi:hypothetical protein